MKGTHDRDDSGGSWDFLDKVLGTSERNQNIRSSSGPSFPKTARTERRVCKASRCPPASASPLTPRATQQPQIGINEHQDWQVCFKQPQGRGTTKVLGIPFEGKRKVQDTTNIKPWKEALQKRTGPERAFVMRTGKAGTARPRAGDTASRARRQRGRNPKEGLNRRELQGPPTGVSWLPPT